MQTLYRRRKEALFGGQSINIARAKILGHTPLIEVQGSRVLQTVQLLSTTINGQQTCTEITSRAYVM